MKKIFLIIFTLLSLSSCQQDEKTVTHTIIKEVPAENDSGGMDSSGGDTIISNKSVVEDEIQALAHNAAEVFYRLSLEYLIVSKPKLIDLYGENGLKTLEKFFDLDGHSFEDVLQRIKNNEINLEIEKNNFCKSNFGKDHKAGSATGNIENGTICLSIPALQRNNPEALTDQVIALFFHELGHLIGMDEAEAESLQRIVLRGQNFLIHNPLNKSEFNSYIKVLNGAFKARDEKFFERESVNSICREINKTIVAVNKLEVYASIDESRYFDRRFPTYISSDIFSLSTLMKQINGFCSLPMSNSSNLERGDRTALMARAPKLYTLLSTISARVERYLHPLRDQDSLKNHQLLFSSYQTVNADSFEEFVKAEIGKNIPQECLLQPLNHNLSFFPLGKPGGYPAGSVGCRLPSKNPDSYYDDYVDIPVYWNPKEKLPYFIRREIDRLFKDKIIELKMQGSYFATLSFLFSNLTVTSFPKEARILSNSGIIKILTGHKTKEIQSKTLENLTDVLIKMGTKKGAEVEHVIVYGLHKATLFGILNMSEHEYQLSAERMTSILISNKQYEVKFNLIKSEIQNLGTTLF